MQISQLSTLVPDVELMIPKCPEGVMLRALRKSARELFVDSGVWTEVLTLTTVDDQLEYTLAPSLSSEIIDIEYVRASDESEYSTDDYYLNASDVLIFDESVAPDSTNTPTFTVRVSLSNSYQSSELPTHLLNRFQEGIVAGAIANLAMVQNRPYYNPNIVSLQRRVFLDEVTKASQRTVKGNRHQRVVTEG